jgi:hypothetical protein
MSNKLDKLTTEELNTAQTFMKEQCLEPASVITGLPMLMAYWLGLANGLPRGRAQSTAQALWQHYMVLFFEQDTKRKLARHRSREAAIARKFR